MVRALSGAVSLICLMTVVGCESGVRVPAGSRAYIEIPLARQSSAGGRAPAAAPSATAEQALPACVLNLSLSRGGDGCVLCANNSLLKSMRKLLGQTQDILDVVQFDLSSNTYTYSDILTIMAQTRQGKDLVGAFEKYYRTARLYISERGKRSDCADRLAYFDANANPPTIFLCTKDTRDDELGILLSTVAHEMTHALDYVNNPAGAASIAPLKAKGLTGRKLINALADNIFQAERLAYSTQYQFEKELVTAFPCYADYMRSKMRPGSVFPSYVSDKQIRELALEQASQAVEEDAASQ